VHGPAGVSVTTPKLRSGVDARPALRPLGKRVGLALAAVALLPLFLSAAVLYLLNPGELPVQALIVLASVAIVVTPALWWVMQPFFRRTLARSQAGVLPASDSNATAGDSLRDWLTGLGNYRAFHEELERQIGWFNGYQVPFALLLVDLDDLKLVNDSDGQAAGDDMLRTFGLLLQQSIRYADRAFRIGADEFAVLMPHTDAAGALQSAKRLQERAAASATRPIHFSGGISTCPDLAASKQQLYAQAEAALYWCKRHGRSSVDVFHPVLGRGADHALAGDLSAAIAQVISGGLLRPVYQPIIDLATGEVIGFEGLIRPSSESGFADPASMFIAAETVGRTVELDRSCLASVVAGARSIPLDRLLTLNISPRTVEAPHFSADTLVNILTRNGMAPQRVVVELTERETVQDLARVKENLSALQSAGIRIAADDVGAGNSGLRLLSQFRFDIVKVDLSLVQEGAESASSRAVLRSLLDLAVRWRASVIAEGIETTNQLRTVRELGIPAGQGYLLARPAANTSVTPIDVTSMEAGVTVLERRSPTVAYETPVPVS
jgi:diguanylate cyclase (GGDEF)-like protein